MASNRKDTARRWKIAAHKSGDVVILRTAKDCPPGALIFYSTATKEEAEGLVTRHCRLSRADNKTMFLNRGPFSDVDELHEVAALFRETHLGASQKLRARIERLERARMNAVLRSSQYTERDRRRDEQLATLHKELEALRAR